MPTCSDDESRYRPLGAIGAAVFRAQLPGEASGVGGTIGALVQRGGDVADAARVAYVDGMQTAAAISSVLVLVAAAAMISALRRGEAPVKTAGNAVAAEARS